MSSRLQPTWKLRRWGGWCALAFLSLCTASGAAEAKMVAHFYAVNDSSSWDSLRANAAQIQLLSPRWFVLNGKLQLESSVDPTIVDWSRQRHLRMMPLLTNDNFDPNTVHLLLQDDAKKQELISELVQACRSNRFWGIQLDWENVPAPDRDAYTAWARELASQLQCCSCRPCSSAPGLHSSRSPRP